MFIIDPSFHMWFSILTVVIAMVFYATDKISMEYTSIGIICALLVFFYLFPLMGQNNENLIGIFEIFKGFSNPALITVMALLVLGQAIVQTGALNEAANIILKLTKNNKLISIGLVLIMVAVISAFMNNTPVVVIFIPIMIALAKSLDMSTSSVMIPLSYAAIIGGMMTLIGSSTNLLVSGVLLDLGLEPLGFFDFTVPGLFLASIALIYVIFLAPKFLPDRQNLSNSIVGDDDREFIAQIEISASSEFIGKEIIDGKIEDYDEIVIKMIQRGEHAFLPPFEENMVIKKRDIIIVAATRKELSDLLSKNPDSLLKNTPGAANVRADNRGEIDTDVNLVEVIITPASRMIGRNLEQIGFHHNYNCVVLGIQRKSRIIRARLSEIRLAAGDVLLLIGKKDKIMSLQSIKDLLLLEWSSEEIHSSSFALRAGAIFSFVIAMSAFDILPIAISSFIGAGLVLFTGCINIRQATRALDSQIFLMIAASLALGSAMNYTGAAKFLSHELISLLHGASPIMILSIMFAFIMIMTNILSNNASAVLFTPIAVGMAHEIGVDPKMFIFAVIFACNCSFITPIGYQTNLLVMGPGHYKFSDFMRSGIPLAIILWISYIIFASWYF